MDIREKCFISGDNICTDCMRCKYNDVCPGNEYGRDITSVDMYSDCLSYQSVQHYQKKADSDDNAFSSNVVYLNCEKCMYSNKCRSYEKS